MSKPSRTFGRDCVSPRIRWRAVANPTARTAISQSVDRSGRECTPPPPGPNGNRSRVAATMVNRRIEREVLAAEGLGDAASVRRGEDEPDDDHGDDHGQEPARPAWVNVDDAPKVFQQFAGELDRVPREADVAVRPFLFTFYLCEARGALHPHVLHCLGDGLGGEGGDAYGSVGSGVEHQDDAGDGGGDEREAAEEPDGETECDPGERGLPGPGQPGDAGEDDGHTQDDEDVQGVGLDACRVQDVDVGDDERGRAERARSSARSRSAPARGTATGVRGSRPRTPGRRRRTNSRPVARLTSISRLVNPGWPEPTMKICHGCP